MKKILFIVMFASALISCKKEVTELPPATQTGANTFGAKVNGELWTPQKFSVDVTAPELEAHYLFNHNLIIQARNFASEPVETEFEIYLQHVVAPGTYLLNANTNSYPNQQADYGYYVKRKLMPVSEWMTNTTNTGKVDITKVDTINKIVSGTFEFRAIDTYGGAEPITVSDGRFDVNVQ